jgi:hypothetical protein
MSVNKLTIRKDGFVDKQLTIPVQFTWDYIGQDQSIDAYESEIITEVIGVGRDFEVSRFAHTPLTGTTNDPTDIKYEFNFYSGTSLDSSSNWITDYRAEGFTTQEVYYYSNNYSNSFFKLDLYDNFDEKRQKNYVTIIIPTQQGLKMNAIMQTTPVTINKPSFVLDYVGDKEGFFLYWLKKRTFLDIDTFYMTAKFYDAKQGVFVKMMNMPQSSLSGNKYVFDSSQYFYYRVHLDYDKQEYQVFNMNPNQTIYLNDGERAGTLEPIKWYEYVNP